MKTVGTLGPRGILPSNPGTALLLFLLLSTTALAVPGCSGCFKKSGNQANQKNGEKDDEKDKEKEEKKPDFEVGRLRVQPNDTTSLIHNAVKPGHWLSVSQRIRANNYDFPAQLVSGSVNRNGRPVLIEHTPYQMSASRPAPLPKGQQRNFEMTYYIPRMGERKAAWLHSQLRSRRGGREVSDGMQPTTTMPDYQYYLVVLSADPAKFLNFKRLDSVMPPDNEFDEQDDILYYRVVLPKVDRNIPLPSHALTSTAIAVIVWDEVDPNQLSPAQQEALLDWLHFGGQLVISGPNSMDLLRGSFLDPYMAADKVKAKELHQADFDTLNGYWSLVNKRTNEKAEVAVDEKPLVGVDLKPREEADEIVNTGGLVYERFIGRGRIVTTAFSLSDRKIMNWGSFDGFFNNALLRRPRRIFRDTPEGVKMSYPDRMYAVSQDPRLVTTVRLFSRDIGAAAQSQPSAVQARQNKVTYKEDPWRYGGYSAWKPSGVGGWNDISGAANMARQALKAAAGISIPPAAFVFKVIVVYLIFLVPVNWLVFRLIGRVELAWVAAPVIAIIGSVAVVKLAQLDIGFARSRTEAAILELHGGYRRGHLTRYTALYTSLSTTYEFRYDDETAVAQPFPSDLNYQRRIHDKIYNVYFQRDKQVRLTGFTVPSNSTGMVHSEQMYSLEGPIRLIGSDEKGFEIQNNSEVTVKEAVVLRRTGDVVAYCYLKAIRPKTSQAIKLKTLEGQVSAIWADSDMLGRGRGKEGDVSLSGMATLATENLQLADGEFRLVGWTDENLKGTTIRPAAGQALLRTLVLVHLRGGQKMPLRPDFVLRAEVDTQQRTLSDPDVDPFDGQR